MCSACGRRRAPDVVVGVHDGRLEGGVAEGVVEVHVRADDVAHHDVPAEAADVVEHLAALDVARAGVDDDRSVAPEHEPDVDVPLAIPCDEDAVGDLDEAARTGRPRGPMGWAGMDPP